MSENNASVIETRTPVIGPENKQIYSPDDIERQWRFITEAVRRDLITKPKTRNVLLDFCATPVTEDLPNQFVNAVSNIDKRVAKLGNRYRDGIKDYLKLPAVPDEQIRPDIRHAPQLTKPEDVIKNLTQWYGKEDPMYEKSLRRDIEEGTFLRGITEQERLMIAKRYKYARDIKLFALGAEIVNQGRILPNENGEIILPSGIRMVIDLNQDVQRADLLSPHLWERRKQLKDRVYEIEVNDRKYILKEKKTARHTDTAKGGHMETRSSLEELEVARQLQKNGTINKDRISVSWERPIGYAIYPDGFSFNVFEYEEGLIQQNALAPQLVHEIIRHRSQFEEEYQLISEFADKHKDSLEVLKWEDNESEPDKENASQLSFEDFARVKALRMQMQAYNLIRETLARNGYSNIDLSNNYSYRIKNEDQLQLEIVGFDFEYVSKISPEEVIKSLERQSRFIKEVSPQYIHSLLKWSDDTSVTRMQKAAYFAMLEAEGILKKDSH